MDFWITVLICGCTIGLMTGLLVMVAMDGHWFKKLLACLLAMTIMGFAVGGAIWGETSGSMERWNNGVCVECGGAYKFSGGSQYRTSDTYFYSCEVCDHTIETSMLMN